MVKMMKRHSLNNEQRRLQLLLLSMFSVALLLFPTAAAFQISPAASSITVDGPIEERYELRLINDATTPLSLAIELPPGVDELLIVERQVLLLPGEMRLPVTVKLSPEELVPGETLIPLSITASSATGGQFGSSVTLLHNLRLQRPYPGSYVEGSVTFGTLAYRYAAGFTNRGLEATTMRFTGRIYDGDELLYQDEEVSLALPPLSAKKHEGNIPSLAAGAYTFRGRFTYLDQGQEVEGELSASFKNGIPSLSFTSAQFEARRGEIIRLPISATLAWNRPVTASARLQDSGSFQETPAFTLEPGLPVSIPLFLETAELEPGNHTVRVLVRGDDGLDAAYDVSFLLLPQRQVILEEGTELFSLSSLLFLLVLLGAVAFYLWLQGRTRE
jgi:hypothetical protein